jgi:hypothetical protein
MNSSSISIMNSSSISITCIQIVHYTHTAQGYSVLRGGNSGQRAYLPVLDVCAAGVTHKREREVLRAPRKDAALHVSHKKANLLKLLHIFCPGRPGTAHSVVRASALHLDRVAALPLVVHHRAPRVFGR